MVRINILPSVYFGTKHLPANYGSDYVKINPDCLEVGAKDARESLAFFAPICVVCTIYLHVVR